MPLRPSIARAELPKLDTKTECGIARLSGSAAFVRVSSTSCSIGRQRTPRVCLQPLIARAHYSVVGNAVQIGLQRKRAYPGNATKVVLVAALAAPLLRPKAWLFTPPSVCCSGWPLRAVAAVTDTSCVIVRFVFGTPNRPRIGSKSVIHLRPERRHSSKEFLISTLSTRLFFFNYGSSS